MALTGRARDPGPVLHPRICAVVAAASGALHLGLALQNQHGPWLGALMVALAGACLPCTAHIWQHSHPAALQRVMGCALAMAGLHGMLLVSGAAGTHTHLAHSATGTAPAQTGTLLAVVALELATALLAATLLARLRTHQQRTHQQHSACAATLV